MARRVVFMDDLESSDVEADAGTITFALEGSAYEIDLSTKNATKLRSLLGPFIAAARKTSRSGASPVKVKTATGSGYNTDQLNAIRAWARTQGMSVSDKGRVPGDIILAFEQAQAPARPPADKLAFSG